MNSARNGYGSQVSGRAALTRPALPAATAARPEGRLPERRPLTVSVIIPVHGRHDLIRDAVRSAFRQSYPVHEVIVVDDGSTPRITHAHLDSSDSRLRIVSLPKNGGPAAARNVGIREATGDLLAFLDSDDVWFADKLEVQMEHYWHWSGQHRLFAIACGWDVTIASQPPVFSRIPVSSSKLEDFVSGCWFSPGSTLLIARDAFDAVGPFSQKLLRLEDFEWFLRFTSAGGHLITAPVIGASIRKGRRARYTDVRFAAREILAGFPVLNPPDPASHISRRLQAWLHVEMAAAARNEGRWGALAWHLATSLCLAPRTSIEIKRWWDIGQPRGLVLDRDSGANGSSHE